MGPSSGWTLGWVDLHSAMISLPCLLSVQIRCCWCPWPLTMGFGTSCSVAHSAQGNHCLGQPSGSPSVDASGLSGRHILVPDPFGVLLCWLSIPRLVPVTNSCMDHTFVESAPSSEDQDLRVTAFAGSPPIGDGGDQAEWAWRWITSSLWCPQTRTHIFFAWLAA